MHKDYGNILIKFQQIPVHGFQEIDLHHLHPFYGEMHKDDGKKFKTFKVNQINHLRDMDKPSLLQDCTKLL